MVRKTSLGAALVVAASAITTQAGGWGVITVKQLPDYVEVGRPLALAFTVMSHGKARASGLKGSVEAVSGQERVSSAISESTEPGLYQTSVLLPRPGEWVLKIRAGFELTLLPVSAVEPGAQRAAMSDALRGRHLFVAKGCVTCHQHKLQTQNVSVGFGPELIPNKYQPEFLARILADPATTVPARPDSPVRMPNLQLDAREIASLVAFINSGTSTAASR